jgi:hypothetical protein
MSRYDQPTQEPDYDRYEPKPIDVQDEPTDDDPIDPAEHAAHAIIDALATFEQELAITLDLSRVQTLKNLLKRAYASVDSVDLKASAKFDEILERRR